MLETIKNFVEFGARFLAVYLNAVSAFLSALAENLEEFFVDN